MIGKPYLITPVTLHTILNDVPAGIFKLSITVTVVQSVGVFHWVGCLSSSDFTASGRSIIGISFDSARANNLFWFVYCIYLEA